MMRLFSRFVALVGFGLVAGLALAQGPPRSGVNDPFSPRENLQFSGVRQVTIRVAGQERTFRESVSFSQRRMRTQFLEGPLAGQFVIEEGTHRYQVIPAQQLIRVSPARPEVPAMWMRGGRINRSDGGTILGRSVQRINFHHGPQGNLRLSLWQDPETRVILRREVYQPQGRVSARSEFLSLEMNARVDERLFELPAGFRRVDPLEELRGLSRRADLPIQFLGPESGFEFSGARLLNLGSQQGLVQTYNRFGDTLTLVLLRGQIDGDRLRSLAREGEAVLTWTERGLTFAIIGQVPQEDLRPLRQSLRPR